MKFEQMIDTYIEAFMEQGAEPGQGLVNRNRIQLLQNLKDTLGGKVLSVDTLLTAVKEVEIEGDYQKQILYVDDLISTLEEAGIKCK